MGKVGWKKAFVDEQMPILPISGWMGDNLIKKSDKMGWWSGMDIKTLDGKSTVHVDTLLDCLEKLVQPPKRDSSGKMRVPLSGVYKIKGVGDVLTGRVEQGAVKPGDECMFLCCGSPSGGIHHELQRRPPDSPAPPIEHPWENSYRIIASREVKRKELGPVSRSPSFILCRLRPNTMRHRPTAHSHSGTFSTTAPIALGPTTSCPRAYEIRDSSSAPTCEHACGEPVCACARACLSLAVASKTLTQSHPRALAIPGLSVNSHGNRAINTVREKNVRSGCKPGTRTP